MRAPPGPADAMEAPEAKKRPVPMVPPSEIIVNCSSDVVKCRGHSFRWPRPKLTCLAFKALFR